MLYSKIVITFGLIALVLAGIINSHYNLDTSSLLIVVGIGLFIVELLINKYFYKKDRELADLRKDVEILELKKRKQTLKEELNL